ncbi:MAG: YaaL family protein [Clostridiaceae bacterium]|nr:YaaL family protein [Clostridiaceae bacterium]
MNGNLSYNYSEEKGSNFLKKFLRSLEEEYENTVPDSLLLLKSIQQARQEWMDAVANFDQADNDELIDYYIYRMKACQIRYNYLLKKAKEMGIRGELHDAR